MTRQWTVRWALVAAVVLSAGYASAAPRKNKKDKKAKPEFVLWTSRSVAVPSYVPYDPNDPDNSDKPDAKFPTAKVRLRLTVLNADEEVWGAGQNWEWYLGSGRVGREYAEPDVQPFSEANPADITRQTFPEKVFHLQSGFWTFIVHLVRSGKIVGHAEATVEVK